MRDEPVAEDTIVYELHLPSQAEQQGVFLRGKLNDYLAFVHARTQDVFWNNESFQLHISSDENYLTGTTNYGDNVEDEWFIIHLLYELSKFDDQLIIRLEDHDGQTLLIESANHIPKWLDPDNSDNRVFVYMGCMHIVPKQVKLDQAAKQTAIDYVRQHPNDTLASLEIQASIEAKVSRYPQYHQDQLHRAKCFIPSSVANILKEKPQLISQSVNAFYQHGPIEGRMLRSIKNFTPDNRVMRAVTFTRNLYAKLIHLNYVPDKRTGWKLPPQNSTELKSHDLGMKVAFGFEILLASSKKSPEDDDQNNIKSFDFGSDAKWNKYVKNLTGYGYFRDELEGSKLYLELMQRAKESYFNSFVAPTHDEEQPSSRTQSIGSEIASLLSKQKHDYEKLKQEETLAENQIDDDDSWLNVTAEQLDQLLEECFAPTKRGRTVGPQDVTKLVRNFVNRKRVNLSKPDRKVQEYMRLMDNELKSTNVGIEDFLPHGSWREPKQELDSDDYSEEESDESIRIDTAICHNLLEAYNSGLEASQPGAACNLLQSLGLRPSKADIRDIEDQ